MSVERLNSVLALINQTSLKKYDEYYRGEQPLAFISPEVRAQVGDRIPEVVLNVPRVVIGSIEERLDLQGFAVGNDRRANEKLSEWWRKNDLDEWSQLCHIESLKHGIAFVTVWGDDEDEDAPRIAVESAHQMAVEFAPGTRKIAAAAKRWADVDEDGKPIERAVLYLPDTVEKYQRPTGGLAFGVLIGQGWTLDGPDAIVENPLGEVPVVAFINRPSLTDMSGESELRDVMPLTDAINKLLSDMMTTSEYHAEPRRYATGMQVPREAQGSGRLAEEARQKWEDATKGKTWLAGEGVEFGQFAQADLQNFKTGVDLILSKVAMVTGLTPGDVGITTENPPSAESRRVAEVRQTRKTKRKTTHFGGSWERVMTLAAKVQGLELSGPIRAMWQKIDTPTFAQDADAVQKLTAGDRPVITIEAGREILGFTTEQIAQMDADAGNAAASAATADVAARMDQARGLMDRDGLSLPAALAAVGLLQAAAQTQRAPTPPPAPSAP